MSVGSAPGSAALIHGGAARQALRLVSVYGLLVLLVVLTVAFSVLLPTTFPTAFNARSILSDKSVVALVALAVMIPMAAGHFDLSVGYLVGLCHILAIGLQVNLGWPWPIAVAFVVAFGAVVGLVNGLLVTKLKIDSFIATLGIGTIAYGLASWYTGGRQVLGDLPVGFRAIAGSLAGTVPLPAIYVLVIGLGLWIAFEYLPIGRYLYVLGSNPRAAELVGISPRRYVTVAFVASGTLTGFAGVVLGARLGVGQSSVGAEFLLPAFVGALLGATSIRPGRVNVWGTILAVLVLAVAVAGLQQLGASFFVEPLFNGTMLIAAVGLAGYASRRQARTGERASRVAVSGGRVVSSTTNEDTRPSSQSVTGGTSPPLSDDRQRTDEGTGRAGDG